MSRKPMKCSKPHYPGRFPRRIEESLHNRDWLHDLANKLAKVPDLRCDECSNMIFCMQIHVLHMLYRLEVGYDNSIFK